MLYGGVWSVKYACQVIFSNIFDLAAYNFINKIV